MRMKVSTKLLIATGVMAAATVVLLALLLIEVYSTDASSLQTPTPTQPYARATHYLGGLEPGRKVTAGAWSATYVLPGVTLDFELSQDTSNTSLAKTHNGSDVIEVSTDATSKVFNTVFSSTDASALNGVVFGEDMTDAAKSFMIPFEGDTCLFGYQTDSKSKILRPQACGYSNGEPASATFMFETETWSYDTSPNILLPELNPKAAALRFLALYALAQNGTTILAFGIVEYVDDVWTMNTLYTSESGEGVAAYFKPTTVGAILFMSDVASPTGSTVKWEGVAIMTPSDPEHLTPIDYTNEAARWTKDYYDYKAPRITHVTTPQTFYANFDVSAFGYAAPTVQDEYPFNNLVFRTSYTLPKGMVLNAQTGTFEGVPLAPYNDRVPLTVTNTASNITSKPVSIQVTVRPKPSISYGIDNVYATYIGVEATIPAPTMVEVTSPRISSGVLPAGLSMQDDGSITGTPTGPSNVDGVVIEVTATAPEHTNVSPATVTILVYPFSPDRQYITINYQPQVRLYYGRPMQNLVPTLTLNTRPVVSIPGAVYTSEPVLPKGMVLNPDTGVISGTPEALAPKTTHRLKAKTDNGEGSYLMIVEVDGVVKTPSETTLTQYEYVDYEIKFSPDVLDNEEILASTVVPTLPEGLTIQGRHIRGTVLSSPFDMKTFEVDAAFHNQGATGYVLARGLFHVSVLEENKKKNHTVVYASLVAVTGLATILLATIGGLKRRKGL